MILQRLRTHFLATRLPGYLATILLTPPLLAPVRYQSGEETLLLNPAQGPAKAAFALPAAGALATPTVIAVSPTLLSATTVATPTTPSAIAVSSTTKAPQKTQQAAPPTPNSEFRIPNSGLMPETTALICTESLKTVIDISLLSYQQKQQPALAKVTMAATVAGTQAEQRIYPNLTALGNALNQLSFGTPNKKELSAAVANTRTICANPNPAAPTPGSRIPIERPN